MKDNWVTYPLRAFADAMSTTVGGLFVIVAAMTLGSGIGSWIIESKGIFHNPEVWTWADGWLSICRALLAGSFGAAFMTLVWSCVQLWGLLYVLVLIYLLYRLLHEDDSRLLIFYCMTVVQTIVTFIATLLADPYTHDDMLFRAALTVAVFAAIFITGYVLYRRMVRNG